MTETTTARHRTLLGLADIAALAGVQRAVVSVWRSRSVATGAPFPDPVTSTGGRDRFAVEDVVAWLEVTGRGNNPHVREEAALHAVLDLGIPRNTVFEGLTALLALKAVTGARLATLAPAGILDVADDVDSHDDCLYREIEALGEELGTVAAHADAMASAGYTATAALDRVLGRGAGSGTSAQPSIDPKVASMAARVVHELAPAQPVIVDPTGSADIVVAARPLVEGAAAPTAALPPADVPDLRRVRRRVLAHGWHLTSATSDDGSLALPPGCMVAATFPSPADPKMTDEAILRQVEDIALAMDDSHAAVVIGPSSALVDRPSTAGVERALDAVLRTHRVRAIVRLPAGLRRARPRERLALWVLGPAQVEVPIADRWLALADITAPLSAVVREDLITDVVAAAGPAEAVRSHAFRFARLARTSRVIAASGDLVAQARPRVPTEHGTGDQLQPALEKLSSELEEPLPGLILGVRLGSDSRGPGEFLTLGQLVRLGAVRLISGNRVDSTDLIPDGDVSVIGPEQVRGGPPLFVDRLTFSSRYPAGRYTEPGDIVVTTTGEPDAVVDDEGLAVVVFPARVLRLVPEKVPGLVPAVVVNAIRKAPRGAPWRSWPVPLVPPRTAPLLAGALATIATAQRAARARLDALEELSAHLADGVAAGTLTLIPHEEG